MSKITPINSRNFITVASKRQHKSDCSSIGAINSAYPQNSTYSKSNKKTLINTNYYSNPITYTNRANKVSNRAISFMGKRVYIVDGGNHATNMEHFAHAISNYMDTVMCEVETNSKYKNTKQLKSLEQQLKNLNLKQNFKDEYIAIPALASVPILNIQDQYNQVMSDDKKFTPENMKSNKKNLLEFLQKLYENPDYYRTYIGYMDQDKQGLEYAYGVIQEINKLIKKEAHVYVPSGHPQDETLKWMAEQRGLKPELYHYIATGNDKDKCVEKMHKEIKDNNWYNFNLLSLSDANIVGVKDAKNEVDYVFAAYDSCITDGARGVYNFSPVRSDGKLIGYSYTDTSTNEYPFEEFPANDEVESLVRFVGKLYSDVVATPKETEELKKCIANKTSVSSCADKLYSVENIFSEKEIEDYKINLKGEYVDKSLNLFFSKNSKGEIIFPKCDCEGSGKPSVLSMWGSCFAVFNAIARDIKSEESSQSSLQISTHLKEMDYLKNKGLEFYKDGCLKQAEDFYNNAINIDKTFSLKNSNYFMDFEPHYLLANVHYDNKRYDYAASCYNNAINVLSKQLFGEIKIELPSVKKKFEDYNVSKLNTKKYDETVKKYKEKSLLTRLLSSFIKKPNGYNEYLNHYNDVIMYNKVMLLAEMYKKLSNICEMKNETYPAKVCEKAAEDIKNCTQRGNKVLEYRSQGIQYIGDLYNEIEPN